jgi:cytochrome oxidase Cu insertion factor (SCO1/SenC/PrrC family)
LDERSSSRAKLVLLLACFTLPVLAATLAYRYWQPDSFSNYGELLPPVAMSGAVFTTLEGGEFYLRDLNGKWTLVTVDSGNCEKQCEQKLYKMRQLRLTQGKNRHRIARLWLISDSADPAEAVQREYEGTLAVREGSEFVSRLPAEGDVRDHIYLIDPTGNLMMRYPKNSDASRMVKDLNRLLRLSGG